MFGPADSAIIIKVSLCPLVRFHLLYYTGRELQLMLQSVSGTGTPLHVSKSCSFQAVGLTISPTPPALLGRVSHHLPPPHVECSLQTCTIESSCSVHMCTCTQCTSLSSLVIGSCDLLACGTTALNCAQGQGEGQVQPTPLNLRL